jgi:hypothetical protein
MGNWKTDWNRGVLEHIVVLLFALANLSDLAAGASFLRRRQVLGILSQGEAEARAFVIGLATSTPVAAEALESIGDATLLAASFRALALLLCALPARARKSALLHAAGPRAGRSSHKTSGSAVRWLEAPPAPDTS